MVFYITSFEIFADAKIKAIVVPQRQNTGIEDRDMLN